MSQLSLGSETLGRWTCPGCNLPRLGPRWEVVHLTVLNGGVVVADTRGGGAQFDPQTFDIVEETRIVCSSCAHDYPNGRRRQCPRTG